MVLQSIYTQETDGHWATVLYESDTLTETAEQKSARHEERYSNKESKRFDGVDCHKRDREQPQPAEKFSLILTWSDRIMNKWWTGALNHSPGDETLLDTHGALSQMLKQYSV